MSVEFRILGQPEGDNALWVQIDSGQQVSRLMFDCGEGCPSALSFGDILDLDGLFFSHYHMDHIAGFDSYFRCVYDRASDANVIWGPPGSATLLHHRFQGYLWNIYEGSTAEWWVHEVHEKEIRRFRFAVGEALATSYEEEPLPRPGASILTTPSFTIEALTMEHRGPSLAYIVREQPKRNISMERVRERGWKPGPWMQSLKTASPDQEGEVKIGDESIPLAALREALLVETPGESIAYLTDFLLDSSAQERLIGALQGVKTVVCESQYRSSDSKLAEANFHMTTSQVATLAKDAQVSELVLFHLSRRYRPVEWLEMLEEAKSIFPHTSFPSHWTITDIG